MRELLVGGGAHLVTELDKDLLHAVVGVPLAQETELLRGYLHPERQSDTIQFAMGAPHLSCLLVDAVHVHSRGEVDCWWSVGVVIATLNTKVVDAPFVGCLK